MLPLAVINATRRALGIKRLLGLNDELLVVAHLLNWDRVGALTVEHFIDKKLNALPLQYFILNPCVHSTKPQEIYLCLVHPHYFCSTSRVDGRPRWPAAYTRYSVEDGYQISSML
jgi:hypothetical protein